MHRLLSGGLLLLSILVSTYCSAQQKWPNSLLWRITGKALSRPSYLYGTMHLQDKRLFTFGDSVYRALEMSEGFALEVDFKEMLDSIFTRELEAVEEEYMKEDEVIIDRRKLDKSADSILKAMGIRDDRLSKKELKKIHDYRLNKMTQQGEMQTIVDGFLYGIALRQGKWIGGVEDIHDQLDLMDEMGGDLTPEEVLQPEADMRLGMEQMISIYLAQDLQSIDRFMNGNYKEGWKDMVLTQRNIKMAYSMDSLSPIRSMFYAIGAAHLPGDSGVISLLRNKGYTVEPVFSSTKTPGEVYVRKLSNVQWKRITNEDSSYSIEMPGFPSEYDMFGQVLKMKMFFDLTTMTFYMSGQTIGNINRGNTLDKMFRNIAERLGEKEKSIRRKNFTRNDLSIAEGSFENLQGAYTLQLIQKGNSIYMLMAGSNKKSNLSTADVQKFFNSFQAYESVVQKTDWTNFTLEEKAFSVDLPGKPKPNSSIDKAAIGTAWAFTSYDYVDPSKGLYYLVQVRDIKPGYFLDGDSAYFNLYEEEMGQKFKKVLRSERSYFDSFPAFYFDGQYAEIDAIYKTFTVIRGSRLYSLIIGGQSDVDFSDAARFFNSFRFLPYSVAEWKKFTIDGFTTSAPAPIIKMTQEKEEGEEETNLQHYSSYNPVEALSYNIYKQPFDSLYWAENDSSYFAAQVEAHLEYGDSLVDKKSVLQGSLKAMEMLIKKPGQNTLHKIRFFVSADTLYTLFSYIPSRYINDERHQKFFTDFRLLNERQPLIYHNKAKELMQALRTTDSTGFDRALAVFNSVNFTVQDLPHLHEAILHWYRDSSFGNYGSLHGKLVNTIATFQDSSTIRFVGSHFRELSGDKEELKYPVLRVLSQINTKESYELLKSLLISQLPKKGSSDILTYSLMDSLQLTRTLYPEILNLNTDSAFLELIVTVTNRMIDSNLLSVQDILSYQDVILKGTDRVLTLLRDSADRWWEFSDWIYLTGKFNDAASNARLQEFVKFQPVWLKQTAIITLLKNNQAVDGRQIERIAADTSARSAFYESLKEIQKESLFPAKYTNQKSIAESELYSIASDEYEVRRIEWIGERSADFMGKKQKFLLFKLTLVGEEEDEAYLAIAGPYPLNSKEILLNQSVTDVYWSELFNKTKIDTQFKTYLKEMQEYLEDH